MSTEPNRILIVEDDAGLAELIGDALRAVGLQVDTVASGRDCLAWLADHGVDLLLIDYSLPDMNAAALVEKLRHTGAPQPFIVTTGRGDEEVAVQLMKLGALDYLVKDARLLERLPGVVGRVLNEVATARRLEAAELALQESERRFRHLLESVTDYIYSVRLDRGRPVETTHGEGCAAVTGYRPADYLANPRLWLEMVPPEDRAMVEEYARNATSGQVLGPLEHRIVHRDGSIRWVQNTMVPRRDASGQLVACDGIVADITERKRAESRLRESERRYAELVNKLDGIVWEADARTFQFTFVSQRAVRLLGYPLAQWLDDPGFWPQHIHPDDRERAVSFCLACTRRGEAHDFEYRMIAADGRAVWLRDIVSVEVHDGEPVILRGVMVDITERKRAEAALRESEERFRAIVESAGAGYFRIGRDGCFSAVNDAWLRMHGLASAEEIVGRSFAETQEPGMVAAARAVVDTLLGGGSVPPGEFSRRLKDGSIAYHSFSVHPVRQNGEIVGLEGFLIDTTALRKAQADYRMLFDTMLDGFALHDIICDAAGRPVDYRFLAINPAFCRLTGLKAEKVIGRTVREVIPQIEPFWIEIYGKVALTGEPAQFEHSEPTLGRHYQVAAFQTAPGKFAVVFVDETERRRAQDALARDEAELSAIYDHAPVMMLLIGSDRKVRRLNQAALEFAAKTPSETAGLRAGDLFGCINALDDPQGCGYGRECAECPLRRTILDTLEHGVTHHRVETRPRFVRGHDVIDVTILASSARLEIGGERTVLLCLEDVSQQKLAEQRVREQAALLDVTRDAIMVVDLDRRIIFWNRGAERLYGWPAGEAAGRTLQELMFDGPRPEVDTAWQKIRTTGEWSGEWRQRSRAGAPIIAACRGVLMTDPAGEARSILLTASDVTEAKRIEAQYLRSQRLESLGSLASGVAHDLNNVFTPITMSVEMLRGLAVAASDHEMLNLLGDSARRGADIVRQLLLFGRGSDAPRQVLSVSSAINEIGRLVQSTFPKNITLARQTPSDLWPVHGDQTQLHQVLLNLCVNARDAMPQGGRLTVAAENVHVDEAFARENFGATAGGYVVVRVTDTGGGIPPEIADKIFDPFFTTKQPGEGTGLGLATVLGIVRSHQGFITVRSQPGAGCEFAVYLPAHTAAGQSGTDRPAQPKSRGRGELVLVVDDEAAIRTMMELALRSHGYQVLAAADGQAAKTLFAAHVAEVRLVVTDMMMPGLSGIETVRALRRIGPQVAVVAMSGDRGHRGELEKLGPPKIHLLSKPFTIDNLLTLVREALDAGK
jgi:PAS domain S-box-containing protein